MYVLRFSEEQAMNRAQAGGKGASLARMAHADFPVPDGFVILPKAFEEDMLKPEALGEIQAALSEFAHDALFAVRSSATAEDGAAASFAGMYESELNVAHGDVQDAVRRVFDSSHSERVREYAASQGIEDSDSVAVVVQRMVNADFAGVLFTADPQTSDRFTTVIEAVEGLGEALVSGRKTPATWRIREGEISGDSRMLDRAMLMKLHALGKRIEAHYGCPQDIEWCVRDGEVFIVQSRPVTTLFPLPAVTDGEKHCYISGGHMQMMTDAVLPLGLSVSALVEVIRVTDFGGHTFIDVTHDLHSAYGRSMVLSRTSSNDPLMNGIVRGVLKRREYIRTIPKGKGAFGSSPINPLALMIEALKIYRKNDASILDEYERCMWAFNETLDGALSELEGVELIDAILNDQPNLMKVLMEPTALGAMMVGMFLGQRLDKIGEKLTGEALVSSVLSKGVGHNVTSRMGIALSEVADVFRGHPQAVTYLETAESYDEEALEAVDGGQQCAAALRDFLKQYGMRCTGEIDVTRTRFREDPSQLFPALLSDIRTLPDGHGEAMVLQGISDSRAKTEQLAGLCKTKRQAKNLRKTVERFRNFVGAREYTKYFWMGRYDVYKRALMRQADRLVAAGVIDMREDIYYLTLSELRQIIERGQADRDLIECRRRDYRFFKTLTPPRVMFSDGEVPPVPVDKDVPAGALSGQGVSSGTATGRARVIFSVEDAHIEQGDILVTRFTDPSWTPVFISIAALVTEVGGMMTHGSVITREYGLPAVVGVPSATTEIHDGDTICVNGDKGYVQILNKV